MGTSTHKKIVLQSHLHPVGAQQSVVYAMPQEESLMKHFIYHLCNHMMLCEMSKPFNMLYLLFVLNAKQQQQQQQIARVCQRIYIRQYNFILVSLPFTCDGMPRISPT